MLIFICVFSHTSTRFCFIFQAVYLLSQGRSVSIKRSFRCSSVFIKTDVKIGSLPIPIAYWSGFGIFKQNRENPDEIGMVGQSDLVNEIQMDKNHTRGEGYASVFLFDVQVFIHLQILQFICYFEVEIRKNKITFL